MVNLVNGIAKNILNATSYSRCTDTALGVYAVGKAKGDTAMMDRPWGTPAMQLRVQSKLIGTSMMMSG